MNFRAGIEELGFSGESSDLFKCGSEFVVVHLYAIIEVDLDLFGGQRVEDITVVVFELFQLLSSLVISLRALVFSDFSESPLSASCCRAAILERSLVRKSRR